MILYEYEIAKGINMGTKISKILRNLNNSIANKRLLVAILIVLILVHPVNA